jgi:hypothetical protein
MFRRHVESGGRGTSRAACTGVPQACRKESRVQEALRMTSAQRFRQDSGCPAGTEFRPGPADFQKLDVAHSGPPSLTIVIDTEEEFDWAGPFDPANHAVTNIAEQYRAQTVFRRHGVVPTYVVDYPVAADAQAAATLRRFADNGDCDIGAHLHPWVTPPGACRVDSRLAYPGNLPPDQELDKLAALTACITGAFGRRPVIYKAGRYGLGAATPAILRALGYRIDVSLVPYTDFSGDGGPDFSAIANSPVRLAEGVVALPLSVSFAGPLSRWGRTLYPKLAGQSGRALHLPGFAARLGLLERLRLSPEGHSAADMVRQVRWGLRAGIRAFMLTYHSSSLLPGATPYVRSISERDAFVARLEQIIAAFMGEYGGCGVTVAEMAARLDGVYQ